MKRWFVLFGCFVGMSVATPAILLVPMGLFLKSVTTEFGWSRTEFSLILSTAALSNAIVSPIAGYLVDRFGAPKIIAVGTVLGCGSYAALSLVHSFGGFLATIAFSVAMGNLASYPAFLDLTQRWFDKRLGLAVAVTSTGLAVGVAGFSYLIAKTIALHGWRAAFLTVGVAAGAIGLVNLLAFIRNNKGPVPEAERRNDTVAVADSGWSIGEALRTRDFWLYSVSFLLVMFAVVGCNVHLPALLSDDGATPAQIASIAAIGAGGSLFGRLITGVMLDRFSVRLVSGLFFFGQAIGFLLLLYGLRWGLLAGFLLGAVQGAEIDVLGYVMARRFGRAAYARIFGSSFAIMMVGAIIGPIVMGVIFDRTGSYNVGLLLFPLFPVLAFGLLCLAKVSPPQVKAPALPVGP